MRQLDLHSALEISGAKPNDTLMIHSDAIVAAQLKGIDNKLDYFLDQLIDFIGDQGTLVMPTFSYSFTKNQDFDIAHTPSDVGQLTEAFRKRPGALRSSNPIFSVAAIGKHAKDFQNSAVEDCFGEHSAFGLLHQLNAKIICLGCAFDRMTFVHFVEQALGVSYRYFKNFSGHIIDGKNQYFSTTRYFVRDLSIDANCSLNLLQEKLILKGLLVPTTYGRFSILTVSTKNFYRVASELISEEPYALIVQKGFPREI